MRDVVGWIKQRIKGALATLFFVMLLVFRAVNLHPFGVNLIGYAHAEMWPRRGVVLILNTRKIELFWLE